MKQERRVVRAFEGVSDGLGVGKILQSRRPGTELCRRQEGTSCVLAHLGEAQLNPSTTSQKETRPRTRFA